MKAHLKILTTSLFLIFAGSSFDAVAVKSPHTPGHSATHEIHIDAANASAKIPLYRFARNDNPSHFFTASEAEKNVILSDLAQYFTLEGPSHYVFASQIANTYPVFRIYNSSSGAHFYTANESERDNVLASMDWFRLEGIAFFVFLSPEPGTVPIYRFYVPQTGSHYFTADEAEKNSLLSSGQTIKQYDGVAWYAFPPDQTTRAEGAKLAETQVIDQDFLMLRVLDGKVDLVEDLTKMRRPYTNIDGESRDLDVVTRYTPELDPVSVQTQGNYMVRSHDDDAYGISGQPVAAVHRRSKINGMAIRPWSAVNNDYTYETTKEHQLFLRLPEPLEHGATYTLSIHPAAGIDTTEVTFTYNIFQNRTEAIHVNLTGYWAESGIKAADLYQWMGDGGARDYSAFEGNTVYLYNATTQDLYEVGNVSFWMGSRVEFGHWNLTGSPVWNVDFTGSYPPGTYRLAIEGIGCSEDFVIHETPRKQPFDVAVQGYYFMRIGQPKVDSVRPVPRQPLYIPGEDPINCKVYLTSMHPWNPAWNTFVDGGDRWDQPDAWSAYRLSGYPSNPNARGGYSDAADWDRHPGHVANIYDMLMPFILSNGLLSDDDTGIAESGNGVPDLLDSARYEVDFWLSLKTDYGYGSGVTNPTGGNVLYQAGATGIMAWTNALNAAMLAEAYRICQQDALMQTYLDAAETAYNYADGLGDPMLQDTLYGGLNARGIDLKMMAAAFLYNVTGNTNYENVLYNNSVVRDSSNAEFSTGSHEQLYSIVAYLTTPRAVHYPALQENMRAAIMQEARAKEAGYVNNRPSRRSNDQDDGWFQTAQCVQRTIVAHFAATHPDDRAEFLDALLLEADWGLGRNPTNMIQMTTASTPLETKRSVELCYTTGQFDGVPGLHPGHTPYMNVEDWWDGMIMFKPSWMTDQCYPSWSQWPHAEAHFNSRHVFANSEFTPRQTMRGKLALYAYLLGLEHKATATD